MIIRSTSQILLCAKLSDGRFSSSSYYYYSYEIDDVLTFLVIVGNFAKILASTGLKQKLALLSAKVRLCFDISTVLCDDQIYLKNCFALFNSNQGFFAEIWSLCCGNPDFKSKYQIVCFCLAMHDTINFLIFT